MKHSVIDEYDMPILNSAKEFDIEINSALKKLRERINNVDFPADVSICLGYLIECEELKKLIDEYNKNIRDLVFKKIG